MDKQAYCRFPECKCPMDPGPDPNWCAIGLPHRREQSKSLHSMNESKATPTPGRPSPADVDQWGAAFAARLFAGRKGHGGGPCSYMRLTEQDLARMLSVAYDEGARAVILASGN